MYPRLALGLLSAMRKEVGGIALQPQPHMDHDCCNGSIAQQLGFFSILSLSEEQRLFQKGV